MSTNIDDIAADIFNFDIDLEINRICESMRSLLRTKLHRRGFVVAVSGGIDSSVSLSLAVTAIGAKKTFALLLPEKDSSSLSTRRGQLLVDHWDVDHELHDIAPTLEAIGCYRWRDDAIIKTFPDYGPGWKSKIVITGGESGHINHFNLVVQNPQGQQFERRLGLQEYLVIVAATNFKQRIRKTLEFFHADRLNYAVIGTPNRVEYDQGFFVKNGDGAADVKPIAHLYKTQVYAMARHMNLPEDICGANPTTDTYSLPQGQDEFYYNLPYKEMDVALWCFNTEKPKEYLAGLLGVSDIQAEFIYKDIVNKRRTTAPLHWQAILIDKVAGPITSPDYY